MNLKRLTLTNERDGLKISIVYQTKAKQEKQDGSLRRDARKARDAKTIRILERAIQGIRKGEYEEVMHGKGEVLRWEQVVISP